MNAYVILLLPIIILVAIICLAPTRGQAGEANVAARLKALPKSDYTVFNNLLIQRGEYSSQIDHVVVSKYGVFVIETKNYKGTFTEASTASIGRKTFGETNTNYTTPSCKIKVMLKL